MPGLRPQHHSQSSAVHLLAYSHRTRFWSILWSDILSPPYLPHLTHLLVTVLRALLRHRKLVRKIVVSNSKLTLRQYYRLMSMCVLEMACTIPLCIYVVYSSVTSEPIYKWRGLAELHRDFRRIDRYTVDEWVGSSYSMGIESTQWFNIGCAFVFFLFFGMTEEARRHYRNVINTILRRTDKAPMAVHELPKPLQ